MAAARKIQTPTRSTKEMDGVGLSAEDLAGLPPHVRELMQQQQRQIVEQQRQLDARAADVAAVQRRLIDEREEHQRQLVAAREEEEVVRVLKTNGAVIALAKHTTANKSTVWKSSCAGSPRTVHARR